MKDLSDYSGFNEKVCTFREWGAVLDVFRAKVNEITKSKHNLSIDHFPSQIILEQFKRDTRPGLCIMFLEHKYGLVEQPKLSNEFGKGV